MMKALGIDPGTRSFDLTVVDGEEVVWEDSIDTTAIAENPQSLIEAIEEANEVDIIVGPSGYGVPITFNRDIIDPRRFALEVLLLTRDEDLRSGVEKGELGIRVYEAIVKVVVDLWRRGLPVCYIPSCILLPTIPAYRKINKLDMGTADKMAVAALGVFDQSSRESVDYAEVNFILVEMGFGYNAAIAIDGGRIVDAVGGTLFQTSFLSMGAVDGEIAVMGREWIRSDVFHGGVADICGTLSLDEAIDEYERFEEPYYSAMESMLEGLEKTVRSLTSSVKEPREILLSGRYARHERLRNLVCERLGEIAPVRQLNNLLGAKISKEAAQGYAIIGEGIAGGVFSDLIKHMRIDEARGTVLNWVFHPRLKNAKERLLKTYIETVREPKL
ncbi:DUF1464 family protein [Candidatus Bathyarchaeota archaeon]|nr:DUF1464 family protein [Candidatus Bathyarchaeota archaeon]